MRPLVFLLSHCEMKYELELTFQCYVKCYHSNFTTVCRCVFVSSSVKFDCRMMENVTPKEILQSLADTVCEQYHICHIPTHKYSLETCRLHLLPSGGHVKEMRGDMNHVFKVQVTIECHSTSIKMPLTLKCAPRKVLVR